MISDYTQTEFDQYWACANDDGPSGDPEELISTIDYGCDPNIRPIIPLEFGAVDMSGHIVLFNGLYWFDLGEGDIINYSGVHTIPDGTTIDLTGLSIAKTYQMFTDASIYHLKSVESITSVNPHVFKIITDDRLRVYPTSRAFSVTDACLELDDTIISQIETLTETRNYVVVNDARTNVNSGIFDKDVSNYMIRWKYDDELEVGEWVLSHPYERLLNRVMLKEDDEPCCQVCVPMHKESDEYKQFLPYVLNMTWNDI